MDKPPDTPPTVVPPRLVRPWRQAAASARCASPLRVRSFFAKRALATISGSFALGSPLSLRHPVLKSLLWTIPWKWRALSQQNLSIQVFEGHTECGNLIIDRWHQIWRCVSILWICTRTYVHTQYGPESCRMARCIVISSKSISYLTESTSEITCFQYRIYVSVYACMHVCMCVSIFECISVRQYVRMHVCMCEGFLFVWMFGCMCVCTPSQQLPMKSSGATITTPTHPSTNPRIQAPTHTCVWIYVQLHTYTCKLNNGETNIAAWHIAVCCGVLRCVAVFCSVLQYVANRMHRCAVLENSRQTQQSMKTVVLWGQ